MVVKSTYFEKKEIHKGTWRSPDGSHINQIDHVLIEQDEEKCITDIRSYRGPDADSDHFLVGIKLRQEIPQQRNNKRSLKTKTANSRIIKNEERNEYAEKVKRFAQAMHEENEIDSIWENIKKMYPIGSGAASGEG